MIRYYSASRQETIWTRLGDGVLVASFALAIPAIFLCNAYINRIETAGGVFGMIRKAPSGEERIYVSRGRDDTERDFGIPYRERHATFIIDIDQMIRGFPLESSRITRVPIIDLREYLTAKKITDVDTSPGTPMRSQFIDALRQSESDHAHSILAMWDRGDARFEQNWWGWASNFMLWWVGLFVIGSFALLLTRFGAIIFFRARSAKWEDMVKRGLCPYCGYDLRGLEFSDRCPECGELQET